MPEGMVENPWAFVSVVLAGVCATMAGYIVKLWTKHNNERNELQAAHLKDSQDAGSQALEDAKVEQREMAELVISVLTTMDALNTTVRAVLDRLPKE